MAFKLKSGNRPVFKMMGSSPLHYEKDPSKLAKRKNKEKKPMGPYEKGIIYKGGKKYYKASDGSLHTGQVSDYEAELAEDRKGYGSGGGRKVMKDGSKNKTIMDGKAIDFKNRHAKKSDAQKRVEQKRRDYNKMSPAEKKKLQDAADARRKAFEKSRKKGK
tara:strand:- start:466 stop:948 length:483 start_codon:yes stop_codon:yes gene_type:complete